MTHPKIIIHRRSKSLMDLALKKEKAKRRGHWTVEDIDYAIVYGQALAEFFKKEPEQKGV